MSNAVTEQLAEELCPVNSSPERRFREKLPKDLFRKKPHIFVMKLAILGALLAVCLAAFLHLGLVFKIAAGIGLGILYAHMVELQHELLHGHAFASKRLNDILGVIMGIPMLSSYHGYKFTHLRHHRDLGTPANKEFFSYKHRRLNSLTGFLSSAFSLHRYAQVAAEIKRALLGQVSKDALNSKEARAIRLDYLILTAILAVAVGLSVYFANPVLIFVWALPVLLVSEAVHFLIETPEHYGIDTQNNPNPLTNTRTIEKASGLAFWLSNGNNLHTAHHYHHGVPMSNVKQLNRLIAERIDPSCVETNYLTFYGGVLAGKYRYKTDESCMREA